MSDWLADVQFAIEHLVPEQVFPSETTSLIVEVNLAQGWHIYGRQPHRGLAVPTQLEVNLPAGVEVAGDWIANDPVVDPASGDATVYRDQVVFRQRLRALPSASPGDQPGASASARM